MAFHTLLLDDKCLRNGVECPESSGVGHQVFESTTESSSQSELPQQQQQQEQQQQSQSSGRLPHQESKSPPPLTVKKRRQSRTASYEKENEYPTSYILPADDVPSREFWLPPQDQALDTTQPQDTWVPQERVSLRLGTTPILSLCLPQREEGPTSLDTPQSPNIWLPQGGEVLHSLDTPRSPNIWIPPPEPNTARAPLRNIWFPPGEEASHHLDTQECPNVWLLPWQHVPSRLSIALWCDSWLPFPEEIPSRFMATDGPPPHQSLQESAASPALMLVTQAFSPLSLNAESSDGGTASLKCLPVPPATQAGQNIVIGSLVLVGDEALNAQEPPICSDKIAIDLRVCTEHIRSLGISPHSGHQEPERIRPLSRRPPEESSSTGPVPAMASPLCQSSLGTQHLDWSDRALRKPPVVKALANPTLHLTRAVLAWDLAQATVLQATPDGERPALSVPLPTSHSFVPLPANSFQSVLSGGGACPVCLEILRDKSDIIKHCIRVRQRRYKCKNCELSFISTLRRRVHEKTHKEILYPCIFCKKKFPCKKARAVHQVNKACSRYYRYVCRNLEEWSCSECPYLLFSSMEKAEKHARKHSIGYGYSCPICNMRFRKPGCVLYHARQKHRIFHQNL